MLMYQERLFQTKGVPYRRFTLFYLIHRFNLPGNPLRCIPDGECPEVPKTRLITRQVGCVCALTSELTGDGLQRLASLNTIRCILLQQDPQLADCG
jgi:hypothetical protein